MLKPWTQVALAERLDCVCTMVTRLLGDLRDGGDLRWENNGRWWLLKPLPARW